MDDDDDDAGDDDDLVVVTFHIKVIQVYSQEPSHQELQSWNQFFLFIVTSYTSATQEVSSSPNKKA